MVEEVEEDGEEVDGVVEDMFQECIEEEIDTEEVDGMEELEDGEIQLDGVESIMDGGHNMDGLIHGGDHYH
mgnify:CR=1 FL=1